MVKVPDLSTLGQKKDGKILNLNFPSPDGRNLTVKEYVEYSLHNFDQVGKILKDILTHLQGQNNVNEVYKQRLDTLETVIDAWIKEAKKLDKKSKE